MKLELSEPIIVAQGQTYEEAGWGPWQFPQIGMTDDGRIIATCAAGRDNDQDREVPPHCFESMDQGKTWYPCDPSMFTLAYPRTASGDRILGFNPAPVKGYDDVFEGAKDRYYMPCEWANYEHYRYGDLHTEKLPPHFGFIRVKKGTTDAKLFHAKVEDPDDFTVVRSTYGLSIPSIDGRIRLAPDGSLWLCYYCRPFDPESGKVLEIFVVQYFRSTDNGNTWKLVSQLTPEKAPEAGYFCESDISWTKNGTAVTLLRANGSYICHSTDGGYTWEAPEKFDDIGVYPAICTMKCGATLASYGRPGFFIRASFDPEARVWEDPITVIGNYDHAPEMNRETPYGPGHSWGTCSYSDILPLSDNEALVVYTDFFRPDPVGIKRKSLMVIKASFVG